MPISYKDIILQDDAIANQISLLRFTAGEKKRVLAILTQLQKDLRLKLLGDLTDFSKARTNKLLKEATAAIEDSYKLVQAELDFEGIAKQQAGVAQQLYTAIGLNAALPTETALKALVNGSLIEGAPSAAWWDKQGDDLAFKFKSQVRQGIAGNETVDQIVRRIIGSKRLGTAGIMETSRANARALVHTSIQQVSNDARFATFQANDDIVKGVTQLSTLDSHTTKICIAYSGASWDLNGKPINGTTLAFNGGTPRHWNAVACGEMVKTSHGEKPIEKVAVGDLVLTHRGRFKPVTAVMAKLNESGFIRRIHTETGRVINVTDEHPVLTANRGWLRADELKAGDQLFKHKNKSVPVDAGLLVAERNPNNYPATVDTGEVFDCVLTSPGEMALSINLNNDPAFVNSEVPHRVALDKLPLIRDGVRVKPGTKQNLTERNVGELIPAGIFDNSFHSTFNAAWVVFFHSFRVRCIHGMRLFREAVSPMIFTRTQARCLSLFHGLCRCLFLSPGFDAVPFAPVLDNGLADSKFSFDGPQGFSEPEMLLIDKSFQNCSVFKVNHFNTSIISDITTVAHNEMVANLEVEEDQTYLVDGIIVHNCRSVLTPITKSYRELGLDIPEAPPGTRASDEGQVPASTTMAQFLKSKPKAYVDDLLGPGRADLWRDKKITLQQLVDGDGRELTLKQLTEL